jgi:hypothetical protein
METWAIIWACVLVGVLVVFAGVAAGVAIGGFRDVIDLFASIDKQHERDENSNDNQQDET